MASEELLKVDSVDLTFALYNSFVSGFVAGALSDSPRRSGDSLNPIPIVAEDGDPRDMEARDNFILHLHDSLVARPKQSDGTTPIEPIVGR